MNLPEEEIVRLIVRWLCGDPAKWRYLKEHRVWRVTPVHSGAGDPAPDSGQPELSIYVRDIHSEAVSARRLEIRLAGCPAPQDRLLELAETLYELFGLLIEMRQ